MGKEKVKLKLDNVTDVTAAAPKQGDELTFDTASGAWVNKAQIVGSAEKVDDYVLALGDTGQSVPVNKATAVTVTVPANATVAFPIGCVIEVLQVGAGQVTVAAAGGVTLRASGGKLKTAAQWAVVRLRKRAANEWVVSGDAAA